MVLFRLLTGAALLSVSLVQLAKADAYDEAHALVVNKGFAALSPDEAYLAFGMEPNVGSLTRVSGGTQHRFGYACSETKPCEVGCCGPLDSKGQGTCGAGPKFCGKECTSQCSWKSPCDPGWGKEFSVSSTCPLNACCSPAGFCGITEMFCLGRHVDSPSCPGGQSARQRTIGYYQGWNLRRPCGSMPPEKIPLGQYTHINFAFAYVEPGTFHVVHMNKDAVSMYKRVVRLKEHHPSLQVWIAIGGGSLTPWHKAFSEMASTQANQDAFIDSVLSFLREHGFDGVDLNWEYSGAQEKGGRPEDYDNFVTFCRRLRERFESSGRAYGLSITLPTAYKYLKGYNIGGLVKHIDWFNFMTYDFHGKWDMNVALQAALPHTNLTEVQMKMEILWRNNIDPGHVAMGLGFYGRSFTLEDPGCKDAGCPFRDVGKGGDCTTTPGVLSAHEIKQLLKDGAAETFDSKAAVKVVTWGDDQWVSYDDAKTLKMKLDYANSMCLGGTMIWAIDLDDHDGTLIKALG